MRLGDFVYGQRSKEKAAGKKLGTAALAVFVVLMLSLASGTMSYGMLQLMHPLGLGAFVPAMFYMAASVLTLITAVGYSRALLFASRDLDTLLSMPVSHLTLLLSKLAGLYVYELIFLAVLFVPAYITYFIVAGFTVSGLFTLLVGVLFQNDDHVGFPPRFRIKNREACCRRLPGGFVCRNALSRAPYTPA